MNEILKRIKAEDDKGLVQSLKAEYRELQDRAMSFRDRSLQESGSGAKGSWLRGSQNASSSSYRPARILLILLL